MNDVSNYTTKVIIIYLKRYFDSLYNFNFNKTTY